MRWFGTDGIRGVAGEGPLSRDGILRIGRSLARWAVAHAGGGSPMVALGRDPRPSGSDLVRLLASAMVPEGVVVEDLGVVPTPVVAWWVASTGADLGVAVSASHNPAQWNGIKPFVRGGRKLEEAEEREIEALIAGDAGGVVGEHRPLRVPAAERYAEATTAWLASEGDLAGLHLVVDLAAGAATTTAPAVLGALGARVTLLHAGGSRAINDRCGTEHPGRWLEAVQAVGADAGLAFDGDADRVLLADATGAVLDGDDALVLLGADWRARGRLPGDRVVGTVMSNLGVEERLRSGGIVLDRTAVGDRHVAARMRETAAALGAEPSGHVVTGRDGALVGDALVAGVRMLQAAARSGISLEAHRLATPRYPQVLRSVRVRDRRPLEELGALQGAVRDAEARLGAHGRLLVRYSGTEPVLRIMVEGRDAALVEASVAALEQAARAGA